MSLLQQTNQKLIHWLAWYLLSNWHTDWHGIIYSFAVHYMNKCGYVQTKIKLSCAPHLPTRKFPLSLTLYVWPIPSSMVVGILALSLLCWALAHLRSLAGDTAEIAWHLSIMSSDYSFHYRQSIQSASCHFSQLSFQTGSTNYASNVIRVWSWMCLSTEIVYVNSCLVWRSYGQKPVYSVYCSYDLFCSVHCALDLARDHAP